MNDIPQKYTFKITVIGDGGVGKTSLIKKFTQGSFQEDYIKTIGAQFSVYTEKVNGNQCKLFFWDIAGQDDFFFLRPSFYKESKGAIIVYSLEENERGVQSLNHIKDWHDDIKRFCGNIPVIVFANKVDLVDKNSLDNEKVQKLVKKRKFIGLYQTSAKTGEQVDEAFKTIIEILYHKHR